MSIILRLKDNVTETVVTPAASTTYYLPSTGVIQITRNGHVSFLIYTPDGDPLTCSVEYGVESDGSDLHDLVGAEITTSEYVVGKWNFIHTDVNAGYCRLKVTTGAIAPSSIKLVFNGRPT